MKRRAAICGVLVAAAGLLLVGMAVVVPAGAAPVVQSTVAVQRYDLGLVRLDVPGPMGALPVRLRGVVGIPARAAGGGDGPVGRRPLVIVAHGRHGDNCLAGPFDSETWPCFAREQRNELGLGYLVVALAKRGIYAIAPSLNAAHTAGWGDPDDRRRWPAIVNRTLDAIFAPNAPVDAAQGQEIPEFTRTQIDPRRIGILGHSLSGANAVRFARARMARATDATAIARGRGPIRSLYLLAPAAGGGAPPDLPTTMTLASCDGDTGAQGRRYLRAARRDRNRRTPFRTHTLRGANHNYFNRLLARYGYDDAPLARRPCRPRVRLKAISQQRWLARSAGGFFARTLKRR